MHIGFSKWRQLYIKFFIPLQFNSIHVIFNKPLQFTVFFHLYHLDIVYVNIHFTLRSSSRFLLNYPTTSSLRYHPIATSVAHPPNPNVSTGTMRQVGQKQTGGLPISSFNRPFDNIQEDRENIAKASSNS